MNIAIFASGSGSNAEAIMKAQKEGRLSAKIGLVVTNKAKAGVIQRAAAYNAPYVVLNNKDFANEEEYVDSLIYALDEKNIDFVVLAGYLQLIPARLVEKFRNRITNIHPALLPSFGGKGYYGHKVHEAVLDAGCKVSGVTVHIVDEKYDRGPIISQKSVPVFDDDSAKSLAERILIEEHKIYPATLQLFAEGRVEVSKGRVRIMDGI
ncbi:MAG: phosphoribosylglycinamide formyltransferase [Candidatus Marinimicrobia bacterium]|nr:phosphoribosylglycinamide formyltransferase [Candidatus Neomarinimicrobiota bacterium]